MKDPIQSQGHTIGLQLSSATSLPVSSRRIAPTLALENTPGEAAVQKVQNGILPEDREH